LICCENKTGALSPPVCQRPKNLPAQILHDIPEILGSAAAAAAIRTAIALACEDTALPPDGTTRERPHSSHSIEPDKERS
jgi:hypothetical protein